MKILLIFVLFCVALGANAVKDGPVNKVLVNLLLEQQLASLNALMKSKKISSVPVGDFTLPKSKVIAKGVTLSDLSTMEATDPTYMWTSPDNTIEAQVFVGLKNMTVDIDALTFNNQTFPATFAVGLNSLGFHQKMTLQEDKCQETYSEIAFYKLDQVTIYTSIPAYNNQDISEFVKEEIQPYVNGLMQQPSFLNLVQKYLDFCNNNNSLIKTLIS